MVRGYQQYFTILNRAFVPLDFNVARVIEVDLLSQMASAPLLSAPEGHNGHPVCPQTEKRSLKEA